jgi:hypothetical protein
MTGPMMGAITPARQGLITLVHFSAQPEPILVIEATAIVISKLNLIRFCGLNTQHSPVTKRAHDKLRSEDLQPTKGAYIELRSGPVQTPTAG